MEVVELVGLTETERGELNGGQTDPFGVQDLGLSWRAKDRHVGLRGPDGGLVAASGLLLADVQTDDGGLVSVVGIGGVIVSTPHRRRGVASRLVGEALRIAATMGPGVAMLFCRPDLAEFYERHGFLKIKGPAWVQQPHGLVQMPLLAMWHAIREGALLQPGPIVVNSLPF